VARENIMRLLIATLLVTVSSSAHCQFFNGNELFDLCKSAPQTLSGYVAGVADKSVGDIAFVEFWAEGGTRESLKKVVKPFCMAEAVTLGQMRDVVCKYLTDFPQRRHLAGSALVQTALGDAFPCR
jgi:hypothetical protein